MLSPARLLQCRREAAAGLLGIHARIWLLFPRAAGAGAQQQEAAQGRAAYVRLVRSLPRSGDKARGRLPVYPTLPFQG